jgi:hypothetical protein
MTYACPAWEFTTDTHLSKLQRPAKQGAPHYGNFPRRTPTREVHVAFKIPHLHDFITKLCKYRAEVIPKHDNKNVLATMDKAKPQQRKYKTLKLDGGQVYASANV